MITNMVRMRHSGRFRMKTKIDASVISFPRNTFVVENPLSKKAIENEMWVKLIEIPWFSFEYSYMNWPKKYLKKRIKREKQIITSLHKALLKSHA
jgi:hypothetical protein